MQARLAAGYLTAKEFADKHSIPQPTYAMHELQKRGLTKAAAKRYAQVLNVSASWLLELEDEGGPVTIADQSPIALPDQIQLMRIVVERVDELLKGERLTLPDDKRNEIITLIFEEAIETIRGNPKLVYTRAVNPAKVRRLVKLAS